MFSMTTEYALRAAVYLSECEGTVQTSQRVAEATHTPVRYAARVLQRLVESGLAQSQRGPSGGFCLSRPPSAISVFDVVAAMEPIGRITACPLSLNDHRHTLCPLHRLLDNVAADAEAKLRNTTLADVMSLPVVPLGIDRRRNARPEG